MSADDWNAVLHYWFGGGDPAKRPKWFGGGEQAAQEIREKFGHLVCRGNAYFCIQNACSSMSATEGPKAFSNLAT